MCVCVCVCVCVLCLYTVILLYLTERQTDKRALPWKRTRRAGLMLALTACDADAKFTKKKKKI